MDRLIDHIIETTGFEQVDLAGHSAGGGLGYQFLSDSSRALKVAHCIHVGSSKAPRPAGPNGSVPTLNLWSSADKVVPSGNIEGAVNAELENKDHYEIATSRESYEHMFKFLNGIEPSAKVLELKPFVEVAGRVLTLGENIAEAGAKIIVYDVDEDGTYNSNVGIGFWLFQHADTI